MSAPTESPAWQRLQTEAGRARRLRIVDLLASDEDRVERLTFSTCGITVDASKTRLTTAAEADLLELAAHADVSGWRDAMFAGERINQSERRPALHAALRSADPVDVVVDGERVGDAVHATRQQIRELAEGVRTGEVVAGDGGAFTDVVNIGIGGSDLGPRLVCDVLADDSRPRVHFVANIDPVALDRVLTRVDVARTLFIVASKTFTTLETLTNARAAHAAVAACVGDDRAAHHFIAVTGARERAEAFGIAAARILDLPAWVGGRYSLWSAVGLPVALACGDDTFAELLAGAAAMDRHFRTAEAVDSLPLRLALNAIWQTNFLGARSHVVVPYSERLARLPEYLQQLELESNGKSVDRDGRPIAYDTVPAIWGAVGTTAQHAFFQWLHQGTGNAACDLIAVGGGDREGEQALVANAFAQSAALLAGVGDDELAAAGVSAGEREHRRLPGDRPSTVFLLDRLDARTLGALIALYEHKVFCQAMIWRINPFDQWGVERGKQLARTLMPVLAGEESAAELDASTRALVRRYRDGS